MKGSVRQWMAPGWMCLAVSSPRAFIYATDSQVAGPATTPGNGLARESKFRASSLRGGRKTRELPRIGGAGPPPTRNDLIDVQRAEARRADPPPRSRLTLARV